MGNEYFGKWASIGNFAVLAMVAGTIITFDDLSRRVNNGFNLKNVMFIISTRDICTGFSVLSRRPSKNNKVENTSVCKE